MHALCWEPCVRVYPRVCGVTLHPRCALRAASGLSPRVRGHRGFNPFAVDHYGSIPACAGSPTRPRAPSSGIGVYPRVCGVTAAAPDMLKALKGLSPRVRGHLVCYFRNAAKRGSIPACAGSPRGRIDGPGFFGVYPRVCGVTDSFHGLSDVFRGLSPRVRGHRSWRLPPLGGERSIPACAGSPER